MRAINERDWEARDDAYSLIRAEEIKNDPKRVEKAKEQLDILSKEKKEELKAISNVKKKKSPKNERKERYFTNNGRSNPIKLSR